ncbi:MAG: hypothetical protein EOP53_17880 [Sphingobacteriales bacterium]|nr:MAG: hypothetical protein EOP53_17880 [Sphingobacteriales bacterium]
MRLIILIILFAGCSQQKVARSVTKEATTVIDSLSFLKEYPFDKKESFLVIISSSGAWLGDKQYGIISFRNGFAERVVGRFYMAAKIGEKNYDFEKKEMSQEKGEQLLKLLKEYKIWTIPNSDEGCTESEMKKDENGRPLFTCGIYDAPRYELYLINKGKAMKFKYYVPHHWEQTKCCPGNKNRQAFIKCFDAISALFDPEDMKSKPR